MTPRREPTPESKAADAARARAWRLANPERTKEIQRKSYQKHRDKRRQEHRDWSKQNLEYLREYQRERYRQNPEHFKARERRWRQSIRLEALTHYSRGKLRCACCGEKEIDFLCLDHVDDDGHLHRKTVKLAGSQFFKWLKANGYPDSPRLQVLCANCNFAKMRGGCPHRKRKRGR